LFKVKVSYKKRRNFALKTKQGFYLYKRLSKGIVIRKFCKRMFTELVPGIAMRLLQLFKLRNDKKLVASVKTGCHGEESCKTTRPSVSKEIASVTTFHRNDKIRGQEPRVSSGLSWRMK
jgi:hypothetical protein